MKFTKTLLALFILFIGIVICSEANNSDNKTGSEFIFSDTNGLFKTKEEWVAYLNSDEVTNLRAKLEFKVKDFVKDPNYWKDELHLILSVRNKSFGVALAMLAGGLFIAYMGNRLFKPFLAVSGLIVGGGTFYFGYQKFNATFPGLISVNWAYTVYVVFAVGGVLGSVLFIKAWNLGSYALSAYGGVMLAILVKGMISKYEFSINIDQNLLMIVFGAIGLVFARFVRETAIICTSAISGAFLIFLGLDNLKSVGFREFVKNSITCDDYLMQRLNLAFEGEIAYCLIGIIFVTVTGIYVQFRNRIKFDD